MPEDKNEVTIEDADEYFLVPIQDQSSFYYLGGRTHLNALMISMEASLVIATTGIGAKPGEDTKGTKCYIILNTDGEGCLKVIDAMHETLARGVEYVGQENTN